jgi:hypothetical protein
VLGEIRDGCAGIGIGDHGADRHRERDVVGAFAIAIGALAVLTVLRAVDASEAVFDQRVQIAIGLRINAAAATAVAAARPAARHVFLAPESGDPVAALAGVYFDVRFVDELHV